MKIRLIRFPVDSLETVCEHLSVEELQARYVRCQDATASRHFQMIWLLARGHTISQVSETTAYGERWIEQLLARYNTVLPKRQKLTRGHHAAMDYRGVGGFIGKLREREATAALALEFAILTAARSGEVLGARWA